MRHHILRRILREIGGKDLYIELRNGTRFSGVSAQIGVDGAVEVGDILNREGEIIVLDEEDIVLVKLVPGAGEAKPR